VVVVEVVLLLQMMKSHELQSFRHVLQGGLQYVLQGGFRHVYLLIHEHLNENGDHDVRFYLSGFHV